MGNKHVEYIVKVVDSCENFVQAATVEAWITDLWRKDQLYYANYRLLNELLLVKKREIKHDV